MPRYESDDVRFEAPPIPAWEGSTVSGQAATTPVYAPQTVIPMGPSMAKPIPAALRPLPLPKTGRVTPVPLLHLIPAPGLPQGMVTKELSIPGSEAAQALLNKVSCEQQGGVWDAGKAACLSPEQAAEQATWWGRQSTGVKVAIIGGGAAVLIGLGWLLFAGEGGRRASSNPAAANRRRCGKVVTHRGGRPSERCGKDYGHRGRCSTMVG